MSDGDAISENVQWGGFTGWLHALQAWADKKKEERERKKEEKKKKKQEESIADWTEGPMFLTNLVDQVHLVGTLEELLNPVDVSVEM